MDIIAMEQHAIQLVIKLLLLYLLVLLLPLQLLLQPLLPQLVSGGPDCPTSDTCGVYSTVTLNQNQDIAFAVTDCSNNGGIAFNATDNSSTCPANNNTYCDSLDCFGTPFTVNSGTSNKNIAITVYTGKLGYLACV
jgi:hypothetical protein